jgi:hypothetical protein
LSIAPDSQSFPNSLESKDAVERVLSAIETALCAYGETVPQVIYFQFEDRFGLKKEEIPRKSDEFVRLLDGFFGGGSSMVKTSILRELERSSGKRDVTKLQLAVALKQVYHYWLREQQGYSA